MSPFLAKQITAFLELNYTPTYLFCRKKWNAMENYRGFEFKSWLRNHERHAMFDCYLLFLEMCTTAKLSCQKKCEKLATLMSTWVEHFMSSS